MSRSPVGSSEDFINRTISDPNCSPNVIGFKHVSVGLVIANNQYLISEEHSSQRSFPRVLLEALEGFSGGKANIVYVDVRKCEHNEDKNLLDFVEKLRVEFNPCDNEQSLSSMLP